MPMAPLLDPQLVTAPFRMQPGLRKLAAGEPQLTALAPGSALFGEKQRVLALGQSRHVVPGFDPAPALAAIARQAASQGLRVEEGIPLELAFEEDFAVLDGATGALPWLCVCVPSHWAPEDKLGLDFTAVHAPVADAQTLRAAGPHLVQLATGGERWERHVWTLTPSPRHDQHPVRHPRAPWPDAADAQAFAAGCWLRVERQTFFPVGSGTRQAVFTIRVMLQPLVEAVRAPGLGARLRDSLASMSDAVLAYKGLTAAREPVLRWLDAGAA